MSGGVLGRAIGTVMAAGVGPISGRIAAGFVRLQRRLLFGVWIGLAVLGAAYALWRHGRAAGIARFAVKRAEARVRMLKQAAEVRRDVETMDRAELSQRLSRWMRD